MAELQELKHITSAAAKEEHPSQVLVGASNKQTSQEVPRDSCASEEVSEGSSDESLPSLEPCSRQSSTLRDPRELRTYRIIQAGINR